MAGILACANCALHKNSWRCSHPANHPHPQGRDDPYCDSWDHIQAVGTQIALVLKYPDAGHLQGAGDYGTRAEVDPTKTKPDQAAGHPPLPSLTVRATDRPAHRTPVTTRAQAATTRVTTRVTTSDQQRNDCNDLSARLV